MKRIGLFGALAMVALATLGFSAEAVAQVAAAADEGTRVTFPIGEYIDTGAGIVLAAIGTAAAVAMRSLPAHMQWALTFLQAEKNLNKALAFARAELQRKYGSISWTTDVRIEGIAIALRYARDHFPKLVEQRFGGIKSTEEKLAARLQEWIEAALPKK